MPQREPKITCTLKKEEKIKIIYLQDGTIDILWG